MHITRRLSHGLILCVIFPCIMNIVMYYGFRSNYTATALFHEDGFRAQYEHGIFKYRVLGRVALIATYKFMRSECLLAKIARNVTAPYRALGDPLFYDAYFIHNTIFLVLASIVLYLLLTHPDPEQLSSSTSSYMSGTLLILLSGFVVTPYDTLSIFCSLLSFLLIIRSFRHSYPALVIVLFTGALVRETAVLTLAFFFAWNYGKLLNPRRHEAWKLAGLFVAFFATYLGLRIRFGQADHAIYQQIRLMSNLRQPGLVGIAALPVVSYLICAGSHTLKRCQVFFLASSPYILFSIIVGATWEIRLWAPVWLGLLILARSSADSSRQSETTSTHVPVAT